MIQFCYSFYVSYVACHAAVICRAGIRNLSKQTRNRCCTLAAASAAVSSSAFIPVLARAVSNTGLDCNVRQVPASAPPEREINTFLNFAVHRLSIPAQRSGGLKQITGLDNAVHQILPVPRPSGNLL
jgi:hypothetical protein